MESNLHRLIEQFLRIGDAAAGTGPRHPTHTDTKYGEEIEKFIAGFPALQRDAEYLEFLRSYAGAALSFPSLSDERWMAMLTGFDERNSGALTFAEEGHGVGPDGFLMFAKMFRHDPESELSFGFYVNGSQAWGVHRLRLRGARLERGWYGPSFVEWLRGLVNRRELLFDEP